MLGPGTCAPPPTTATKVFPSSHNAFLLPLFFRSRGVQEGRGQGQQGSHPVPTQQGVPSSHISRLPPTLLHRSSGGGRGGGGARTPFKRSKVFPSSHTQGGALYRVRFEEEEEGEEDAAAGPAIHVRFNRKPPKVWPLNIYPGGGRVVPPPPPPHDLAPLCAQSSPPLPFQFYPPPLPPLHISPSPLLPGTAPPPPPCRAG